MAPKSRAASQLYQEPNSWTSNTVAYDASPSMTGSYVAMLATLACVGILVIGWIVARFVQRVRAQRGDGGVAGRQKKKASIADSVANAIERAKGVGVWLKSTRYVTRGVSDDQLFKSTKTAASDIQNNPFVIRDDDRDTLDVFEVLLRQNALDAQPEQHLAIVICVDEPGGSSKPSVQGDYDMLTKMFSSSLCYGGRYKVVGFTTSGKAGTQCPTSTNLAATLKQLQDANRAWGNVVVCLSAPARVYPRDFIDPSLLKNEYADLKAVEHFARRRPTTTTGQQKQQEEGTGVSSQQSTSSQVQLCANDAAAAAPTSGKDSLLFLGSAGVEFLGDRDAPQDTSSWVDLAQLLDRIRFVTRRRDGDQPIVCLLDLLFPTGDGNGVDSAVSWMQVEALQVHFGEDKSSSSNAPTQGSETSKLQLTRNELLKYLPDSTLLDACKALSVESAVKQALSQRPLLHCLAVCCTNASRYATRTRPLNLLGSQKPVHVASVWFGELVRAFYSAQGGLMQTGDAPAAALPGKSSAAITTTGSLGDDDDDDVGQLPLSDLSRLPGACGNVQTSVFHCGLMSIETVVAYLQHYCAELQGMSTVVVCKHPKSASMPLLASVPLATQVMLMPRPIHTLPYLPLAGATQLYDLAIREAVKLLGRSSLTGSEPSSPTRRRTWELFGESTRVPCGKTQFVKALCWHSEVLRQYCNNVLYVDLRDFVRSPPASASASAPPQRQSTTSSSKTASSDSALWFVDVVSYLCRLASVSAQLHTVEEASDVLREVFFHPEARFLIVLDHVERADVADTIRFWVDKEPECSEDDRRGGPMGGDGNGSLFDGALGSESSVVLLVRGDAQRRCSTSLFGGQGHGDGTSVNLVLDVSQSSSQTLVLKMLPSSILAGVALATCQQNAFDEPVREIRADVETLFNRLTSSAAAPPTASQRNLDVLPLLQFAVRQSLIRRSAVCVADWGVGEIVTVCMEAIFSRAAHDVLDAPLPLLLLNGPNNNNTAVAVAVAVHDRLRVLQAVLLVPKLFPLNHAARVPLHLVRVVSVLFAELTVSRFISSVASLIDFGVLLCENVSCGFTSTAKATFLEDPHAAMLDMGLFLRVNSLIEHSTALTEALRHHMFPSFPSSSSSAAEKVVAVAPLHSVEDLSRAAQGTLSFETVARAAHRAMLSALAPFATKDRARSTAATTNLLFETLQLAATQTGSHDDPLRSTTLQLTQDVFTTLWFLEAVLEFVSVDVLLAALQDLQSVLALTSAEGTKSPSAPEAKLEKICCALQSHAPVIRRNVMELRNVFAACMPELLAELRVSPVLAVEPRDDGTATCANAYDGGSLFVPRFPSVSSSLSVASSGEPVAEGDGENAASTTTASSATDPTPAVTSLLCVAKGVAVAGCSDGSLVVFSIPDEGAGAAQVDAAPAKLLLRIDGSATGHLGEAITDLMVFRSGSNPSAELKERAAETESTAKGPAVVLVSTSRKNRVSMEWNSVSHLVAPPTPLAKLDSTRRVYFPAARDTFADQKEQETLHRFFVDVFSPLTDAQYVGDTQFGKCSKPRSGSTSSARCECLMLRYGLPDMYRGATFSDTTANSDTNSLAVSHLHGLHQCAATILMPGAPGYVSSVTAAQRHNGNLVVVVGTSTGRILLLPVVKEQ